MPGVVVNEHDFVSKNIEVMNTITADSASVNNLTVLDKIDINGPAKQSLVDVIGLDIKQNLEQTWQNQIAEKVTESIAKHGVNIKDALLNNEPLVTNGVLNSSINNIGPLNALKVNGNATVGVMHIKDNRVGINTDSPDSSLSIWDEEVAISIGKKQQNTGFVGTSRSQDLSLGTNNRAQLTIRQDGTVEVDKLKLANRQIGFSETVPNWSGAKGDIMFNSNPTNESVTGWICLGTFRWKGF
jgi:sRNA-binding carbon storage regulator CsrA